MKAIYLDCFSGISGNMLLGAFIDAGLPTTYLEGELNKLPVANEFYLNVSSVSKNGVAATYADVVLTKKDEEHACGETGHRHGHRRYADIVDMIERSTLKSDVKRTALSVFDVLARAEGKVHGVPPEDVTFHEVGATDSIVDIVGVAVAVDYFNLERVFVGRVNTGSGFVRCAHGLMPVPAPATAELMVDLPGKFHAHAEWELTTPTGAAVLKALAVYAEDLPEDFSVERIAYGAGTHDLEIPNVLRLYLGDVAKGNTVKLFVAQTNIDDMEPRLYDYAAEKLFAAGALDVWVTNILMKKNRPAQQLSALFAEKDKDGIVSVIFTETTSIGVRIFPVGERVEAMRHIARVSTKYGDVACKVSAYKGKIVSVSAEYDECKECAEKSGVPLKTVVREAVDEMTGRLGDE